MSAAHPNSAASFSTFAGMHTNEDWSSQQANGRSRGDSSSSGGASGAAASLDDEDEIVQELPIVLNQELAHTLYLMQSPLRPPHRPYDVELGSRVSLQVKPIQKKVEMSYRLPEAGVMYQHGAPVSGVKPEHPGHNFDYEHAYSQVKTVTLQAKNVQPKTNYCAGVLRNGVLHLTPISAVCRFKPQLGYIDDAAAAAAASSDVAREAHRLERLSAGRMTEDEEIEMEEEQDMRIKEEEKKKELQTVVMKVDRKKAGAAGANGAAANGGAGGGAMPMRKQTYAYIKQLEENEKWIPLKLHEQESSPSLHQLNRLVLPSSASLPPPIPFNVPAQQYLSYVNPPDLSETSSSESMIATGDPLYLSFDERLLYFLRNARMVPFGELCVKMQIVQEQQMEHALQLLSSMCWLVQGCWVLKSAIVYDRSWRPGVPVPHPTMAAAHANMSSARASRPVSDRVQLAREYLLTQFARRRVQFRDELLQTVQLELEPLDELLNELARCTVTSQQQQQEGVASRAQWEWKIDTDNTIAKQSTHNTQISGTSVTDRTTAV